MSENILSLVCITYGKQTDMQSIMYMHSGAFEGRKDLVKDPESIPLCNPFERFES